MVKAASLIQVDTTYMVRQVHKFGGSSLKDKACFKNVLRTIKEHSNVGDYIVVSANGNVTDLLFEVINHLNREHLLIQIEVVKQYITGLVTDVLSDPYVLLKTIEQDIDQVEQWCKDSEANSNNIVAFGELWSAQLLHEYLKQEGINSQWLDTRDLLIYQDNAHQINRGQLLDTTQHGCRNIVTGYIASDEQGNTVTLGRNGSDYTATLLAKYFNANCLYLWTDVEGVYSADPRIVASAQKIEHLSFCEAQALSELGSNVLHQKTMNPIIDVPIDIVINTSATQSKGTSINRKASVKQQVKTIASKSSLLGLSVSGINELDARTLQAHLLHANIFSYASRYDKTKRVFHCYVEKNDGCRAITESTICGYQLNKVCSNVSLISIVGQDIRQNHQIIGKILTRSSSFDVLEIFYPANSHTLCLLIADQYAENLLNDLHQTFFAIEASIPIVVLGYGNIGQQFLKILQNNRKVIEKTVNRSLNLVAVANSKHYVIDQNREGLLSLTDVQGIDLSQGHDNSENQIFDVIESFRGHNAIIIDLTASQEVAELYPRFASNHWHIISANKVAASEPTLADSVDHQLLKNQSKWLKNTTVGAGLPVQLTIKKLQESGDRIYSLSGVFSGSLSWLFGQFDGSLSFSELVKKAQDKGYTEPDPREDLSGQDVFRKVRILARELGFDQAKEKFETVIPENFLVGGLSEFWNNAEVLDQYFNDLLVQANKVNGVLRYVATLTPEQLIVKLEVVDITSACAKLNPCDNVFIIHSDWYNSNPLLIQGPGAGKEVTAAGVLNDLVDILKG